MLDLLMIRSEYAAISPTKPLASGPNWQRFVGVFVLKQRSFLRQLEGNARKENGQNHCTQTGPTTLQRDRWSLHVPTPILPHLKRLCLVCIETKKRFKPPCAISAAMQASYTLNMKVLTWILRPINFVHLANQTGGVLHNPPHKVGPRRVHLLWPVL